MNGYFMGYINEPDSLNSGSYKGDNYAVYKAELSLDVLKKGV